MVAQCDHVLVSFAPGILVILTSNSYPLDFKCLHIHSLNPYYHGQVRQSCRFIITFASHDLSIYNSQHLDLQLSISFPTTLSLQLLTSWPTILVLQPLTSQPLDLQLLNFCSLTILPTCPSLLVVMSYHCTILDPSPSRHLYHLCACVFVHPSGPISHQTTIRNVFILDIMMGYDL